ncbi:ISL3 family transposase [Nocardioides dokdonensis]|uniref:ISL3 family transposase n=1 Tax=Nocardioides dokdonensis TaxID=450734 RepID=UPI00082F8029|nr:ISL3 family transposase [Nocardioides dokdonensis]
MRDATLWRALVGCENTVIEGVDFEQEQQQVTIRVRPVARQRGRCGRCQRPSPGYDAGRGRRHWRALDLGTIRCQLQGDAPRVRCREHGVVVAHLPWARHGARASRAFENQVAWLATQTSKIAVTELMRIAWRTVGAVITRVWAEVEGRVDLLSGLTRIGIDEVSYRRGHLYLMVVIDHDTGRLVWAGKGQTKATLQSFFDALGPERSAQITHVTADSAGYIADVVGTNCPAAIQAADPFHVVKWANDALGEVRLTAWREARAAVRANPPRRGRPVKDAPPHLESQRLRLLTRSRYALWKNPENLTSSQSAQLKWIAQTDPRLWRGYQLKEGLRAIFKLPHHEAPEALNAWITSAQRCRIPQFAALAKTVQAQRGPILLAIEHGLSNGRTEAVNLRIRLRTRMAYGFRDPHALIAILMLTLGGHRPRLPGR